MMRHLSRVEVHESPPPYARLQQNTGEVWGNNARDRQTYYII
jgi:hypothetical protein